MIILEEFAPALTEEQVNSLWFRKKEDADFTPMGTPESIAFKTDLLETRLENASEAVRRLFHSNEKRERVILTDKEYDRIYVNVTLRGDCFAFVCKLEKKVAYELRYNTPYVLSFRY